MCFRKLPEVFHLDTVMESQKKLNVLTVNLSSSFTPYLPYIYGVLKKHCDRNPVLRRDVNWLKPIFVSEPMESIEAKLKEQKIDVLALSCYCWNWSQHLEIARIVVEGNPNCLVVAGGPHPDWKDADFFKKFPIIGIVVKQDGEIPFEKILLKKLADEDHWESIPGLIFPTKDLEPVETEAAPRPTLDEDVSPWVDEPTFSEIIEDFGHPEKLGVLWETNRGCPHNCQFCDWGSAIFTKVRQVNYERLNREIAWFSKMKLGQIYIADANFGMFPRDEEIARALATVSSTTGYPRSVDWCASKSNTERVFSIAKIFHDAEMMRGFLIGFQSTSDLALKYMKRAPMNLEKYRALLKDSRYQDLPVFATTIMGCPGETFQGFKETIFDLMEAGFHKSIRCYHYSILPNAPAAQPEYIKNHGIVSIVRKIVCNGVNKDFYNAREYPKLRYIVGHNDLERSEWIDSNVFYAFISALHNIGPTKYLAKFLNDSKIISYKDFYELIFQRMMEERGVLGAALNKIKRRATLFLEDENEPLYFVYDYEGMMYEPERFLYFEIVENIDYFYNWLSGVLVGSGIESEMFSDLFCFQRMIMVPFWERDFAKLEAEPSFIQYDWWNYFYRQDPEPVKFAQSVQYKLKMMNKDLESWRGETEYESRRCAYNQHVLKSMIYKNCRTVFSKDDFNGDEFIQEIPFNERKLARPF